VTAPACPVSLCLIVRDEEANLPACLESAAGLFAETVVVDTGSQDRTKEIAACFGARVFDFPWRDSFAAARNEGLRRATGDWAFWLDADDRLDAPNRAKLGGLLGGLKKENAAYVLKCVCLPEGPGAAATVVGHVRLFRRHPAVRWQYRVHEQILPSLRRLGAQVRWADAAVHHVGYQDPALRRRKLGRDLRLLRMEERERPGDPFTLFNLGAVSHELGRPAQALVYLRASLERSQPGDSIVRKLYALIAQCHRRLRQPGEALAACRAGRRHYPEDAELLFVEGLLLGEQGDARGAELAWLRLLATREAEHFGSVDAGLGNAKARHHLAALYRDQGRSAEPERQWRRAVAGQPDFLPGWLGLADLALAQGHWPALEEVAGRLEAGPCGGLEAAVLRARACLARREFGAARRLLEGAIAAAPRAVWPRVVLSHVLLQEGQDWVAAERSLCDVLALEPGHAEARRNLAVLRRLGHGAPEGEPGRAAFG
jgi:tetratricopeptide (TPR) repeat protein